MHFRAIVQGMPFKYLGSGKLPMAQANAKLEKYRKPKIVCQFCGKKFEQQRKWGKFCSKLCRWRDWDYAHPRFPRARAT